MYELFVFGLICLILYIINLATPPFVQEMIGRVRKFRRQT